MISKTKDQTSEQINIFTPCYQYSEAKQIIEQGMYPFFREIESGQSSEVIIQGQKMLMLGSNSYLGLTDHPALKKVAKNAIDKYGTGNAGSRFLNGTLKIHRELESKLAQFFHTEDALLYGTGYMANMGVIGCLAGFNSSIVSDKMNHASILDGARFAHGQLVRFEHNNMDDLERVLKLCSNKQSNKGILIVVDGVFSMEGNLANLPEIVKLKQKYNCQLMVDDAHGVGVMGPMGRGTGAYFDLENEIDLLMVTFSKSLASLGGAVMANEPIIHYLKHHSRALIFSASMPPANVATVSKALDIMQTEPQRIELLWKNTQKMKQGLKALGYNTGTSSTPIIPIIIGDQATCFQFNKELELQGIFINPVVPPAVPQNRCLIRISLMATHTQKQIDHALHIFQKIGKKMQLI